MAATATKKKEAAELAPSKETPEPEPSLSLLAVAALAFGGTLVTFAAFPPLGLWPLAAVGPAGWLGIVLAPRLPRWSWWVLWLAGAGYWMALLFGISTAHWMAGVGLVALSSYLSIFFVLFVALTRVAVHTLRVPLLVAAPVVWVGMDLLRGLGPLGFSACMLGHAWAPRIELIQIADLTGAYGVSFLAMLLAAGLMSTYDWQEQRIRWAPLPTAAGILGLALIYGYARLNSPTADPPTLPPLRVALIQGSMDTAFDGDPGRDAETFVQYEELTHKALAAHPDIDVIIWPETVFTALALPRGKDFEGRPGWPLISVADDAVPPPGVEKSPEEFRADAGERAAIVRKWMAAHVADMTGANAPGRPPSKVEMLVGMGSWDFDAAGPHRYNSVVHLDPFGQILDRYDKMQPVAFGEYLPLGDFFPFLYQLTPMGGGLASGATPRVFTVRGWKLAPSICFESTIPHLIRRQVAELKLRGEEPDLLVNITNDGWFHGSPILDHHLACGVFRAIENRKPLVIAANTGFSAIINERGGIEAQGPRQATGAIVGEVRPSHLTSLYTLGGDWLAWFCLSACLVLVGLSFRLSFDQS